MEHQCPTIHRKKIVLAYSWAGLDTSVILPWLKDRYPGVKAGRVLPAELGQGDELKGIEDKARKSGADEVVIMDLRQEFARENTASHYCVHTRFMSRTISRYEHRPASDCRQAGRSRAANT